MAGMDEGYRAALAAVKASKKAAKAAKEVAASDLRLAAQGLTPKSPHPKAELAAKAREVTAQAVSKAVETKPVAKVAEEIGEAVQVRRGTPRAPKALHELGMQAERRAQSDVAAHVAGKGRMITPPSVHLKGMRLEEAARARQTAKVSQVAQKAAPTLAPKVKAAVAATGSVAKGVGKALVRPSGTVAKGIAKPLEAAARHLPLTKWLTAPRALAARRFLGPVGSALDVATTGYAGYQAYKSKQEYAGLKERAEKLKVPIKRRTFGSMAAEAITKWDADMDPKVKVWNPKTKKWD